jgi:hypothetical protein
MNLVMIKLDAKFCEKCASTCHDGMLNLIYEINQIHFHLGRILLYVLWTENFGWPDH